MQVLSCGCWSRTPAEVTALGGYTDDPVIVSVTCPRCMTLALKHFPPRETFGDGPQLDFFGKSDRPR
jgi:hypothetical protein